MKTDMHKAANAQTPTHGLAMQMLTKLKLVVHKLTMHKLIVYNS